MKLNYKIQTLILGVFLTLISVSNVHANEGNAELRSSTSDDYRCFVNSQLTQERKYRLQVTCRDLVYPSDSSVFAYVMWGNPTDGGKIIKMGTLDFGKKLFTVGRAYSSVFVTTEPKPGVAIPSGPVVMQAPILPIEFLDRPTTPTPTPEIIEVVEEPTITEAPEEPKEEPNRLTQGLKRASIIIAIVLLIGASVALVLIIRSKKR